MSLKQGRQSFFHLFFRLLFWFFPFHFFYFLVFIVFIWPPSVSKKSTAGMTIFFCVTFLLSKCDWLAKITFWLVVSTYNCVEIQFSLFCSHFYPKGRHDSLFIVMI